MFFAKEHRPKIVAANPEMSFPEVGAELGRQWRDMDEDARKPYNEKAAEDKKRNEREMAAWEAANPGATGKKKKAGKGKK